jgi:exonuclease VII large subunit
MYQIIHTYREKVKSYKKRHGFFKPQLIFQQRNEQLNNANNLLKQTALNYIKTKVNDANSKNDKIKLLNPNTQLKRGFAIATDTAQNIVFSPNQVDVDDVVQLQVAKGIVTTKVLKGEKGDA